MMVAVAVVAWMAAWLPLLMETFGRRDAYQYWAIIVVMVAFVGSSAIAVVFFRLCLGRLSRAERKPCVPSSAPDSPEPE